jgi:hypothetical protein
LSDTPSTTQTCSRDYSRTQILIASPKSDESFIKGEVIKLNAAVISNERTSKSQLVWTSNIDGKLGSGSLLKLNNLSVGDHIITASWNGTKTIVQIVIFQDLWDLYQSRISLHEISAIMHDFGINWIDDSVSGETWKMYDPPKFDQTSTDPSRLVFIAKLRVLKHQQFDEPLPFTAGKTIYAHLAKYTKKINLRLDCDFNRGGGGALSLNRGVSVWDARSSATASDPNACKKPFASHVLWLYIDSLYLLVHENRHNMPDDPGHTTCHGSGNMDQRLEGGSGHAWAAMYLMWVYKYSDDPLSIKNEAKTVAAEILKSRFCSKPSHSNPKVQAIIDELIP